MLPALGDALRSFAISPRVELLNHGSYGACPRVVLDAEWAERLALEADPVAFMDAVPGRLRAILEAIAPRFGADPDGLVFVESATMGVATVLRGLALRPGDRVVTTDHVYGAVMQQLRHAERSLGVVVDVAHVPFPLDAPEQVVAAVTPRLPGARLAVLDAVTSATGLVWPFAALTAACRRAGVPVLVDGAHAPGLVPVDLRALDADWFVGNLHKWCFAPKGTAILWAAPRQRDLTVPLVVSHDRELGWPRAFGWIGSRDVSGWLATPAAFAFVDALGEEAIRAHNDALCARMAAALADRWGVVVPSPGSMRAAMATLPLPGDPPAEAATPIGLALRAHGLEVPVVPFRGRAWLRISAQVYNREESYTRLGDAVADLLSAPS